MKWLDMADLSMKVLLNDEHAQKSFKIGDGYGNDNDLLMELWRF
jgi:hypothetical protein